MSTQQITTYEDQTNVVKSAKAAVTDPTAVCFISEERTHNVRDFMARQYPVARYKWAGTDALLSTIVSLDVPKCLLDNQIFREKVNNFAFLRATVKFRVMFNRQKYQQGCLRGVWSPFNADVTDPPTGDLTNWCGYPGFWMDVGSQNVVEFEVPYLSPYAAYDLHNDTYNWGNFSLRVASQLVSNTGNNTCDIVVLASMPVESICLQVPTPNTMVAPSSLPPEHFVHKPHYKNFVLDKFKKKKSKRYQDDLKLMTETERLMLQSKFSDLCLSPQMNTEPEEQAKTGVLSTVVKHISSITANLGKSGDPEIDLLANAASWVLDAGADSLAQHGYSKPGNMAPHSLMSIANCWAYNSVNGRDNSVPLCADVRNAVNADPKLFGTDYDEMDIPRICMRDMFIDRFTWHETDNPLTVLWQCPVSPGACGVSTVASGCAPTPMAYIMSMFELWRGSLTYSFFMVRNEFYTGRLRLSYWPNHLTVSNPLVSGEYEAAPHQICDLADNFWCDLDIPFVSNLPWKDTELFIPSAISTDPFSPTNVSRRECTGCVVVSVETNLVRPSLCNPSIEVLVGIRAQDDIAFARPSFEGYEPQMNSEKLAQSDKTGKSGYAHKIIPFGKCGYTEPAVLSTGECITNLRTLCRMMTWLDSFGPCTSVQLDMNWMGTNNNIQIPFHYVIRLYRFFRGGTRVKFWLQNLQLGGSSAVPLAHVALFTRSGNPIAPTVDAPPVIDAFSFTFANHLSQNPVTEVFVPNYSDWYIKLRTTSSAAFNGTHNGVSFSTDNVTPISFSVRVGLASGDDFTCGYLIGAPVLKRS